MDNKLNEMTDEQIKAMEYLQMGQSLLGAEQPEKAVEMIDRSLKCDPMNKDAHITKGIAYANMEDYTEAKKSFNNAVKIDKSFADAYFQLGNIAFLENDFEEGIKNYNQAVYCGYNNSELYYNLGLVYEERDEYGEALRNYNKAISLDQSNPVYMIRKATLQIREGKYEEALQTLEKFRMHHPDSFDGYHLTAAVYTMQGQYDKAETLLKQAQEMFPDDKDILFDRMRVLVTKGDEKQALDLLQKAKEMDCTLEEKKEIFLNEGKIYLQNDMERAIESFIEALNIPGAEDNNPEIRYFLMNTYLARHDYENLLKVAKTVDRNDINNPYSLFGVYFECMAMKELKKENYVKEYENAQKYYRNISLNDPSRIDAYLFRAMCYKDIGNYDKALETIDYVILIQPENGQLHQIKGNILKEMSGRSVEAEEEYREAKRLGFDASFLGGENLA